MVRQEGLKPPNHGLEDILFKHIRFEGNKIKDIGVFHHMGSQFTLWCWEPVFKVADFICSGLSGVQITLY